LGFIMAMLIFHKPKAKAPAVVPQPVVSDRASQFLARVKEIVATSPYEAEGALWAARPQEWWADKLGCSTRQVRRVVRTLVEAKQVKTAQRMVDGVKMLLYREGSPDEKSPEDYARMMRAYLDAKFKPKAAAGELTKEQANDLVKRSKRNFGCLVQLAKWWGADALPILKSVCESWTDFQSTVHDEIDLAIDDAKAAGETCDFKHVKKAYPSIPQLRWFAEWRPNVVLEFHLMALQAGSDPNAPLTKPLFKAIMSAPS
jgi:hypothetical protein